MPCRRRGGSAQVEGSPAVSGGQVEVGFAQIDGLAGPQARVVHAAEERDQALAHRAQPGDRGEQGVGRRAHPRRPRRPLDSRACLTDNPARKPLPSAH